MPAEELWPERVEHAHTHLVTHGHVSPIVAVSTPHGRYASGDVTSRCETGSLTKIVTALLLAELAQARVVSLLDRVPDLLPPATPLAPHVAEITLESLACHRSGLPRLPPETLRRKLALSRSPDPYAHMDEDRLVAGLSRTRVRGTPGEAPVRYSNYGFGLLGFLLGRATGLGYERSVHERVLLPLGLTASSFDDDDLKQGRRRGRPVEPWHLAAMAGAGGLRASANDLLRLLEVVRSGTGPLAAAVADTLQPRTTRGRPMVGLGWFMLGGGDLLMHNGATGGATAEIRLERHTGTAVVVLGDRSRGTARAAGMLLNPRER